MTTRGDAARAIWVFGLAIAWPIIALTSLHFAWVQEQTSDVFSVLGTGVLLASPTLLAIAAAEDSVRWRRITAACVAIATTLAVIGYGALAVHTVGCRSAGPAEVASTMVLVGLVAGLGAGLTAWQGGRAVAALRWRGIALATVLGLAMLALAIGAAVFRSLGNGCFGY